MSQLPTHKSSDREAEMNRFKKRFERDLSAFIERQKAADENWDASKWKATCVTFGKPPHMVFDSGKQCKTFDLQDLPKDLTHKEALDLRKEAVFKCAANGFQPSKSRMTQLDSAVIEGVKNQDAEAWDAWMSKHRQKWWHYAKKGLGFSEHKLNLDPEDVVQDAALKFLRSRPYSDNPNNAMARSVMQEASKVAQRPYHRSTFGDPNEFNNEVKHDSWKDFVDSQNAAGPPPNPEKLQVLLQAVRAVLTKAQQPVLDSFLTQHEKNVTSGSYYVPIANEIALAIHSEGDERAPVSKQFIYKLLKGLGEYEGKGIVDRIQQVASEMAESDPDMQEIADYITSMRRANKEAIGGRVID